MMERERFCNLCSTSFLRQFSLFLDNADVACTKTSIVYDCRNWGQFKRIFHSGEQARDVSLLQIPFGRSAVFPCPQRTFLKFTVYLQNLMHGINFSKLLAPADNSRRALNHCTWRNWGDVSMRSQSQEKFSGIPPESADSYRFCTRIVSALCSCRLST